MKVTVSTGDKFFNTSILDSSFPDKVLFSKASSIALFSLYLQ